MPELSQALAPAVYDAQLVRLTDLGQAWLAASACGAPTQSIEQSIYDLWVAGEYAALSVEADEQQAIQAYQQETYGLLAVYTDPLLRALLPAIPTNGGIAQPFVLGVNGGVLGVNGKVLGVGARIIPVAGPPVFNTTLMPGQTVGAVTFTGANGDTFAFNMPMDAATGGPQQMFLFVDGVQVAGIDFPADAVGEYFRLNYNGTDYLSMFQIVPITSRVDLLPE